MNSSYEVLQHQLQEARWAAHATAQSLADMTAAWQGACASDDAARADLGRCREQHAQLLREREVTRDELRWLRAVAAAAGELVMTELVDSDTFRVRQLRDVLDGIEVDR